MPLYESLQRTRENVARIRDCLRLFRLAEAVQAWLSGPELGRWAASDNWGRRGTPHDAGRRAGGGTVSRL